MRVNIIRVACHRNWFALGNKKAPPRIPGRAVKFGTGRLQPSCLSGFTLHDSFPSTSPE